MTMSGRGAAITLGGQLKPSIQSRTWSGVLRHRASAISALNRRGVIERLVQLPEIGDHRCDSALKMAGLQQPDRPLLALGETFLARHPRQPLACGGTSGSMLSCWRADAAHDGGTMLSPIISGHLGQGSRWTAGARFEMKAWRLSLIA